MSLEGDAGYGIGAVQGTAVRGIIVDGKRYLVILYGELSLVHLFKDPCSYAYYLARDCGWVSTVAYFGSADLHFDPFERYCRLIRISEESVYKKQVILGKKFAAKSAKSTDVLMLVHYGTASYATARVAKEHNSNLLAYCKLDMSDGGFAHFNAQTPWRRLMQIGEQIKSRPIDLFTVESRYFCDVLQQQPVFRKKQRLFYLPNGVSEVGINLAGLDAMPKEKLVVTIGRIGTEQKNNELFLNALRKLYDDCPNLMREWRFLLIGPYTAEFERKLRDLHRDVPSSFDHVRLTGNMDTRQELYTFYARASILCMTSVWESFGIATVEGMYFGCCPVITGYGSVAHDQIPAGARWGKIVESSGCAVAQALRDLMEQDNLQELQSACKRYARMTFSYHALSKKLDGLLKATEANMK